MESSLQVQEQVDMIAKSAPDTKKTLRTNPFTTYRDPETGRWMVVKASAVQIC